MPSKKWTEYRTTTAAVLGILILFAFLLSRTSGIQNDENNYLFLAKTDYLGTLKIDGKQPFYYAFNYFLYHFFSSFLGNYKGISLFLFYIPFSSLSLAFLSRCAFLESSKRWALFFLLALHPMILIGCTQTMMESPLLSLVNFLLALMFLSERSAQKSEASRKSLFLLFLAAALLLSLKFTAAVMLPLLVLPFWKAKNNSLLYAVFFGSLFGILCTKLSLWFFEAPPMFYGGISNLFDGNHWIGALKIWPTQGLLWFFYVSPALAVGAAITSGQKLNQDQTKSKDSLLFDRKVLGCALASLVGSLLFVGVTNYQDGLNEVRWHFPLYWLAILFFSILLLRAKQWIWITCILLSFPISYAYVGNTESRFLFWPDAAYIPAQGFHFTTFEGFPVWRWYLFRKNPTEELCVYIPEKKQSSSSLWARRMLEGILDKPQFFQEERIDEFQKCAGPKAYYLSIFESYEPNCAMGMPEGEPAWKSCQWQHLEGVGLLKSEDGSTVKARATRKQLVVVGLP